jgi:hypothetical protein
MGRVVQAYDKACGSVPKETHHTKASVGVKNPQERWENVKTLQKHTYDNR